MWLSPEVLKSPGHAVVGAYHQQSIPAQVEYSRVSQSDHIL